MNMLISLEGKVRIKSLSIASFSAVLLKKVSETSTPTDYGRILGTGDSSPSSSTKASSSPEQHAKFHLCLRIVANKVL